MAAIKASITVDVPLEFADLEWSEFMLQSLLSGYTRGLTDVEPLIDEDDMKAGKVDLTTEGDRLVKVAVELDYTPRTKDTADEEVARAQATLERDLEKYRLFVLDRCEKLQCRTE
ncbi:MAG: hypothetical protein V2J16_11790 [Thermoleophilia bacterium]|jgi:hypothetical protein|nr:hypothetical protein [Thermoleophilia bacterium]